jgi:hypothetical protein
MKTLFIVTILLLTNLAFIQTASATKLSDAEKEGLQLMREEEKLAHDVYTVLYEKWQLPIFNNISNSESRHFEAVGYLLETYEISDPALPEIGKFRNKELSALYNSLITQGNESLLAALEVGAYIEEVDIKDLHDLLAMNPEPKIAVVYENLLRGSENHIRAFTGQLQSRGKEYQLEILKDEEFQQIIQAQHQRGGGTNCVGGQNNFPVQNRNRGKGQRNRQNQWN